MRQPIVLRLIAIFAILAAGLNCLELPRIIMRTSAAAPLQVLGALSVALLIAGASLWISVAIFKQQLRSRRLVLLYLWFMLLIYPVSNVLRALGFNLPSPEIPAELLAGAAIVEMFRYILVLVLLVWAGFSKGLKTNLVARSSQMPPNTSLERTRER